MFRAADAIQLRQIQLSEKIESIALTNEGDKFDLMSAVSSVDKSYMEFHVHKTEVVRSSLLLCSTLF